MSIRRDVPNAENYHWYGYLNAGDPKWLVPKRWGWGWTLNLANSKSWLFLAVILLPAVLAWLALSSQRP